MKSEVIVRCTVCSLQWVYILEGVSRAVGWCGISEADPALAAEIVLRLGLVFEATAALDDKKRQGVCARLVSFIQHSCSSCPQSCT